MDLIGIFYRTVLVNEISSFFPDGHVSVGDYKGIFRVSINGNSPIFHKF